MSLVKKPVLLGASAVALIAVGFVARSEIARRRAERHRLERLRRGQVAARANGAKRVRTLDAGRACSPGSRT